MRLITVLNQSMLSLALTLTALPGLAADYRAPQEGDWVVRDCRSHTGEVLPELHPMTQPWAPLPASRC